MSSEPARATHALYVISDRCSPLIPRSQLPHPLLVQGWTIVIVYCIGRQPGQTSARTESTCACCTTGTIYAYSATDMRRQLHWLPVRQRIVFKLATVTYKARLSGLPTYLQCEIHDYHPSRTLRSTSALLLQQQPATISFAARAFCAAAPTVWNSLGVHTRSADTFLTFKNRLKTELFKSCYA